MEKVGIELKEIKTVKRFCDICGKPAKGRNCRICQRDICEEHAHREPDEWGGDYSYKYCSQLLPPKGGSLHLRMQRERNQLA